jgi:hypothetical protein
MPSEWSRKFVDTLLLHVWAASWLGVAARCEHSMIGNASGLLGAIDVGVGHVWRLRYKRT